MLADVVAPAHAPALRRPDRRSPAAPGIVLDGITTPANVGMILRTATAAGVDGIVVPRRGVAGIDPLVIKASAGVAFHAPVLRCASARRGGRRPARRRVHRVRAGRRRPQLDLPAAAPGPGRASCSATRPTGCRTPSAGRDPLGVDPDARRRRVAQRGQRRRGLGVRARAPPGPMTARAAERGGAVDSGAMGLGDFANKAKDFADQHDEQVDQGLERAGDEAGKRLAGHESQVDGLVDRGKQSTGDRETRPQHRPTRRRAPRPRATSPRERFPAARRSTSRPARAPCRPRSRRSFGGVAAGGTRRHDHRRRQRRRSRRQGHRGSRRRSTGPRVVGSGLGRLRDHERADRGPGNRRFRGCGGLDRQ